MAFSKILKKHLINSRKNRFRKWGFFCTFASFNKIEEIAGFQRKISPRTRPGESEVGREKEKESTKLKLF